MLKGYAKLDNQGGCCYSSGMTRLILSTLLQDLGGIAQAAIDLHTHPIALQRMLDGQDEVSETVKRRSKELGDEA